MELIIISGLSGSGKSIALQTLEDEGFYCVDNLPLSFLNTFIQNFNSSLDEKKIAIGVDARGFAHDIRHAHDYFSQLSKQNVTFKVLFLQASDEILLKRFHETRRKHPLSNNEKSLLNAISDERSLLEPILAQATLIIDTSTFNVHELRQHLKENLLDAESNQLSIQLESFGFKNGLPLNADFIFDARALTNPHWDIKLRPLTGKDQAIVDFFEHAQDVQSYLATLIQSLEVWLPQFLNSNRSYLTISVGCTGGKHRSVYLVEALNAHFKERYQLLIHHRELSDCQKS